MMPAFARLPRRRLNHITLLQLPEGHARQDRPITDRPAQKNARPALGKPITGRAR